MSWAESQAHSSIPKGDRHPPPTKNDQNPKIGYALLMVGRKRFQRMPVTFLQHRTQETIPRAMLKAIEVQIWG